MATADGEIIGSGTPYRVSADSTGGSASAPRPSAAGAKRELTSSSAQAQHKGVGVVRPRLRLVPVKPSAQVRAALEPERMVMDQAPDNSLGERLRRLHDENQRVKLRLERVEKYTTR